MNKIEIALTPALYSFRSLQERHTTVVVDVLRATTAICAAMTAGTEEIVPLDTLEGLQTYRQQGYLLAAERDGKKVGDAEYGNSPCEYRRSDLRGEKLAYSTTNGTVCLLSARNADRVLVGCFSNLSALAQQLVDNPQDVVVLCSGWKKGFSLEDTLFAGALVQRLMENGAYEPVDDASWMALELWDAARSDLYGYCQRASHVRRLQRLNYDEDIRFALTQDTCTLVPRLEDLRLKI